MKELLYIPTGSFFRFYSFGPDFDPDNPTASIEDFAKSKEGQGIGNGKGSYKFIIQKIVDRGYLERLYHVAGIPNDYTLNRSEFLLIEVKNHA